MAERKQFLLRISPSLWKDVERWAADEFRSANGQIEFLLQRAVDERRKTARRVSEGDAAADEGQDVSPDAAEARSAPAATEPSSAP